MSNYSMAVKQLMPNQCVPLHFLYGPSDCCLCNSKTRVKELEDKIKELEAKIPNQKLISQEDFPQEFRDNEKFMNWLNTYDPNWELEYTGNIESMYAAWLGAKKGAV